MASQARVAAVVAAPVEADAGSSPQRAAPHAYYMLALLVLANFLNYADRALPSIISQRMKADLHLSDAQLGFLLGTAFAVFYGVVGLGMGRVADVVNRPRLMAVGLAIWSGMTALAGVSTSFVAMAAARLGVGVGEAAATPCAHSLLSQVFPRRRRGLVLAVYLLGTHLGVAGALIGGGLLLQHWGSLCHAFPSGACRVAGWRATFLVMGAPGLVLALVIAFLREPARAKPEAGGGSVRRLVFDEFSAAVPPLTVLRLHRIGGGAAVARNLAFAAALSATAVGMTLWLGDPLQWIAVAIGAYAVTTWAGVLRRRDPPLHAMTLGSPTFMWVAAGSALMTCIVAAVQVWSAPYAMRTFHAGPAQVGVALGLAGAATSALSALIGGALGDLWKRRDGRAPVWIAMGSLIGCAPAFVMMMRAHDLPSFVIAYVGYVLLGLAWAAPVSALVQDLVPPRMRATAAGAFSLISILVGSGLGPYWAGKVSALTGSLALGISSVFVLAPLALVVLFAASRGLAAPALARRRSQADAREETWGGERLG